MSNPEHTPLCHCGSCEDAVEAAFKTMEQLLTHQCFHWFIAVTSVQQALVAGVLENDPAAAERFALFQAHVLEHGEELADRLEAMLDRVQHVGAVH
jgi:hypothetical protein